MSVTNGKQQPTEPFYRREFKQEMFLYEESSNLASEEPYLTEQFQYFVLGFVGLLFAGCLGLLLMDLLLPRIRQNYNEERRRRPRNRFLHPMDQPSPVPPRREQPRDDPPMQAPRGDPARDDAMMHRRHEAHHVNHQVKSPFQFAFNDSSNEQDLAERPLGRQHHNTRASHDE